MKLKGLVVTLLIAMSFIFSGCPNNDSGVNIEIPGVVGPIVILDQDNVIVDIEIESLIIEGGYTYAIPDLEESYVEVYPNPETGAAHIKTVINIINILEDWGDILSINI